MQKMIPGLTQRQRYWLEHIQSCEASGKSIAEYATEHGVNVRAMYSGKKILVNKGILPATQPCDKLNCFVCVIDGIGCSISSPNLKCAAAPGSPGTPYGQICATFPIEKIADEMQCLDCSE
jgi:hypothetical protein